MTPGQSFDALKPLISVRALFCKFPVFWIDLISRTGGRAGLMGLFAGAVDFDVLGGGILSAVSVGALIFSLAGSTTRGSLVMVFSGVLCVSCTSADSLGSGDRLVSGTCCVTGGSGAGSGFAVVHPLSVAKATLPIRRLSQKLVVIRLC